VAMEAIKGIKTASEIAAESDGPGSSATRLGCGR
jgi:hypothetical protein